MTNLQLLLAIGVPSFMVLLGILLNQRGIDKLESRFDRVDGRMDRMQSDLSIFYRTLGQHDKAIEFLERK